MRSAEEAMDRVASSYVRLVLALGEHDAGYVDAYYGPPQWREEIEASPPPLETIRRDAADLILSLERIDVAQAEEPVRLRREYLLKQARALEAYAGMLVGPRLSFDEESRLLYDAVAPRHDEAHFRGILDRLERLVPGEGPLHGRYERYREAFAIPPARVDAVFRAAIVEARRRTLEHLDLPEGETFEIAYVTRKPWSAYNWYKGEARSLIEINTDLPIHIDRALDLACHEGYPGHHVYNALLESRLVRARGWVEFSVYPLYSPQSLIAEGSANVGIDVAFPRAERIAFERDVLYPLAGLEPSGAEAYAAIQDLVTELNFAHNEAARRYLDGEIDAAAAQEWLKVYALMSPERARQRLRFIDTYRSYVINYNLGRDLVRGFIEARGGTPDHPGRRWEVFGSLLSSPRLPSGLR